MDFLKQFKAALAVSTPLIAVRTFDNKSTMTRIKGLWNKKDAKDIPPMVKWDCVNGLTALNEPTGKNSLQDAFNKAESNSIASIDVKEALRIANFLKEDTIVFFANPHLFWEGSDAAGVIQGIWNLRDHYKARGCMLVLLTISGALLPAELANDFLVLDEPLPNHEEISNIVKTTFSNAKLKDPKQDVIDEAVKALIGLPAFPAEQSAAMCLDVPNKTLDISGLWDRKRQAINQTRGLQVMQTDSKLEDLGGLTQIKEYLSRIMEGKDIPNVILFADEVEKAFAGVGTDTSGVSTKMAGKVLTWLQDIGMRGLLAIGVPGVGKSEIAKAIGNHYGKPVIAFNLADMESGIVGSSNEHLGQAMAMIDSISDKKVLMIATCNNIGALTPELLRRFASEGIYFFDAPDAQSNNREERDAIWKIYRSKYQIPAYESLPNDAGWTGSEIRQCAMKAYRLNMSLIEAAKYIVPVTKSNATTIENLRRNSSGKYLSASHSGTYMYNEPNHGSAEMEEAPIGRKIKGI